MILFTKYVLGMGEKNLKWKQKWMKTRKNSPFGWFYHMEADCFPVSENAENKPNIP